MKTTDPTHNIRFVAAKKLLLAAGFSVRGLKPTGHALPGFGYRDPVPYRRSRYAVIVADYNLKRRV